MSAHLTINRSSVEENQNSGENYGERTQHRRGRDRCSGLALDFRESTAQPRARAHCHTLPIRSAPDGPHHRGLSELRKVAGNDWSDNSFGPVRGADERHFDGCFLSIRNHFVATGGAAGPVSLCAALSSSSPGELRSGLSRGPVPVAVSSGTAKRKRRKWDN